MVFRAALAVRSCRFVSEFVAVVCLSRVPASLLRVASVLRAAPAVAFSGSRSVVPESVLCGVLPLLPVGVPVLVGCARGVDSFVRQFVPSAVVLRASSYGFGAVSFARRSAALVGSVSSVEGVLVSCPGRACPFGLVPSPSFSACFCGLGSGSWASLALAVGSGCSVLVWLPSVVCPPAWGFEPLGGGWFFLPGSGR
jgi:hypothetical protein